MDFTLIIKFFSENLLVRLDNSPILDFDEVANMVILAGLINSLLAKPDELFVLTTIERFHNIFINIHFDAIANSILAIYDDFIF